MKTLLDLLTGLPNPAIYLSIFFILIACGLGVPIPEDVTLFAAGALAYYKNLNVFEMIALGMFGVLLGDSMIFFLGRKYGLKLTKIWVFQKVLTQDRLQKVEEQLKKNKRKVIFFARFTPGLRAVVYFSCGSLGVPFFDFFVFDGLAALLSVPAIVYSVYYFGSQIDFIVSTIQNIEGVIALGIFGFIAYFFLQNYRKKRKNSS